MARTASPPRHRPEQGLWFFLLITLIFFLAFVSVFLFVPR